MTRKLHSGLWLLGFLLLGALLAGFGAFVIAKPAPHVTHASPQPKQDSGPTRYVYPFSVVDGGAQSEPEFQSALDRRDVGRHYADFARYAVKPVAAQEIEVVERVIRYELLKLKPRQRMPKATVIKQYYGISLDKGGRARRIQENWGNRGLWTPAFPLIESFMTRANCLEWLAKNGGAPHDVPRSACVFCPYHSDYEWDRIKEEDPEAWARAVWVDNGLRSHESQCKQGMDRPMFLHRSCQPLELVQLDTRPDPRKAQLAINFAAECMGVCGL